MPLIKPNKFYLDFAYINKKFQSNVNSHVNLMNSDIHVDSHNLIDTQ